MSISRLLEIVRLLCRSVFSTYWVLQNTLSTSMQCWTLPYLQARVCPAPAWAWQGAWPRRRSLAWASSPWWPRWAPCRCPAPRGPSSSSRTQPAPQVGKGHFTSLGKVSPNILTLPPLFRRRVGHPGPAAPASCAAQEWLPSSSSTSTSVKTAQ